ncbi:hypothetical protein LuPra_05016 [Luteitalea pratensis]|uniref:Beta-hexosaminidase bacterial type N-terminal domain-containing protein n=1 Tax=Luteitalea pratensis TaxID=1855912 RepID=A0A143PV96_LUTPR|nr:glycoside hydrolase family 20 zincin-like fold domain-containing protein [Luteitalea pratensis]AMY11754.1 hypothetical protein LuPra_05016 [Luteitalea pratensis]
MLAPVCSRLVLVVCLGGFSAAAFAQAPTSQPLDLTASTIVVAADATPRERVAATMLLEEVQRRSHARWTVSDRSAGGAAIHVGRLASLRKGPLASRLTGADPGPEGYRITSAPGSVVVAGADERGVLFGVGRLLRTMEIGRDRVILPATLDVTETPVVALRGHQLGYRPKTNSYDAWDAPQWEQYIRDLAVFGTNAIELIPPRSDDAADSPHFPRPQMEMMVEMSRIADKYGLDVWVWYPALDEDYTTEASIVKAVAEWEGVLKQLPRVDAIFVPGGDPGHTEPSAMFGLLDRQTANIRKFHPKMQMWMSPQGFTAQWMETFYGLMAKQPAWLTGIVIGPQNRDSLATVRKRIPPQYKLRRYPDITHTIRAEYPVPLWDVAYVRTLDREPINPRPLDQAAVFQRWLAVSPDFLTYSEGCNDDLNKFVWSGLGWNPKGDVRETVRQYARYFVGPTYAEPLSDAIFGLEENWRGPLAGNVGVERTLAKFQAMERTAAPRDLLNWRFQQSLYRAYYDAYVRRRLVQEQAAEVQATSVLTNAAGLGSMAAMAEAERLLAPGTPVAADLRTRVFQLAEALYQSPVHMQLSVPLYRAIAVGRGANLDLIDEPLNDRIWMSEQFAAIRAMSSERERLAALKRLTSWTDPGPGGFYDDLGVADAQPHLVAPPAFREDPGPYHSGLTGFGSLPNWRLSWMSHAEAFYDGALQMKYTGLDPAARYKVRVVYAGDIDSQSVRVRLTADESLEVHGPIAKPSPDAPVEYPIPAAATADGALTLTWRVDEGLGGAGRGNQVAEVWLIKDTTTK